MNTLQCLVLAAAAGLAAGIAHFGRRHAGYRALQHTISELGEHGAAQARVVALGMFLPFGLAMAGVAGWAWAALGGRASGAAGLAACLAVGYLGAAAFPCDPGSPLSGSRRQLLHNLAGGVQYVGGAWTLWGLSSAQPGFKPVAVGLAAAALAMSLPVLMPWRGAVQRVAEVALVIALVAALAGP